MRIRRLKKLPWLKLGALPFAVVLFYAFLFLQLYACPQADGGKKGDVAIVLGAAVWGSRPSPVFLERIRHSVDLYKDGRVQAIIFTGGLAEGDSIAESEAGRQWALAHGVPARAVLVETSSTTTFENLAMAREIMRREKFKRALIVSDPPHMRRSLAMARDLRIDALPSPTPTTLYRSWRKRTRFMVEETWHYANYLLKRPFLLPRYRDPI